MTKLKEPSQRQLRVGEEIRHILSDIFMRQDFESEELHNTSITVTEVDVSPDMRNATAYISCLGNSIPAEEIVTLLNSESPSFDKIIYKKLTMKSAPKVKFSTDNRFDYAARIEELLNKVNKPN